jgi:hypothetical protein
VATGIKAGHAVLEVLARNIQTRIGGQGESSCMCCAAHTVTIMCNAV